MRGFDLMLSGKLKETAYLLLCGILGGITAHVLWYGIGFILTYLLGLR